MKEKNVDEKSVAVQGMCCDCAHGGASCKSWDENPGCPYWKESGNCWKDWRLTGSDIQKAIKEEQC